MSTALYTYALVKSLYDSQHSYLDCFLPFVLAVLPADGDWMNIQQVQREMKARFGVPVPRHSLDILLTRAKRRSLVDKRLDGARITENGLSKKRLLASEGECRRRVTELLDSAREYLCQRDGRDVSRAEVETALQQLIAEHIDAVEHYISPMLGGESESARTDDCPLAPQLLAFFSRIEQSSPHLFDTLRELISGSLLAVGMRTAKLDTGSKSFGELRLLLDANYALKVLELEFDEFNAPALELHSRLTGMAKVDLRIFDFTIEEMVSLLRNYRQDIPYVAGVKVASLFYSLKSKGWTKGDVTVMIAQLEDRLQAKGISLEHTSISLEQFTPRTAELPSILARYKPNQSHHAQNHDLAGIQAVSQMRGHQCRQLENCSVLFLTSDMKLARFNYLEGGHQKNATVPEAIPDRMLMNILWLNDPGSGGDMPLHALMSMAAAPGLVDKSIWDRFWSTLQRLKNRGSISDDGCAALVYDQNLADLLGNFNAEDPEALQDEWVTKHIEDAKAHRDLEDQHRRELMAHEFEQRLVQKDAQQDAQSKAELARIEELRASIKTQDTKIRASAERDAGIGIWFVALLLFGITFGVVHTYGRTLMAEWHIIEPFRALIEVIFVTITFAFGSEIGPLKLRKRLRDYIAGISYARRHRVLEPVEASLKLIVAQVAQSQEPPADCTK